MQVKSHRERTLDAIKDVVHDTRTQLYLKWTSSALDGISNRQPSGFLITLDGRGVAWEAIIEGLASMMSVTPIPVSLMISPTSCWRPTRTSSYIADPDMASATTTASPQELQDT